MTNWTLAARAAKMNPSAIREILKLTDKPGIISLAGGLPSPKAFPLQEFTEACNTVMARDGAAALQYATSEGFAPLRQAVADKLPWAVDPDQVLITTGSQQALDLIGKVFLDKDSRMLVETPTYLGALLHRQRPSPAFWACAALGTGLVVGFAVLRSGAAGLALHPADMLLLGAMLCAAVGYGFGARLSQHMRAEFVICWALVISLPVTVPLAVLAWPAVPLPAPAWAGFAYVSVFSMWLGFFAWYRGLALGGTVRVSQVQLVQPFLGMLFAVPLLGEGLDAVSVGFGLAVMATVLLGRRMPVRTRAPQG